MEKKPIKKPKASRPAKKAGPKKPAQRKRNGKTTVVKDALVGENDESTNEMAAAPATSTASMDRLIFDIKMIAGSVRVEGSDASNTYISTFPAAQAKPFINKVFPKVLASFYGSPVVLNVEGTKISPVQ